MELSIEQREWLDRAQREEFLGNVAQSLPAPPRQVTLLSFTPAFIIAGLKDTLDLIFAWIPGISWITGLCFGSLIFLVLLLIKTDKVLLDARFLIRRALLIIFASVIDGLPIAALFPITILTVYVIYRLDKAVANTRIEEFFKLHGEKIKWVTEKL